MQNTLEYLTYILPTFFIILILYFFITIYILVKKYILLKIKYYEIKLKKEETK